MVKPVAGEIVVIPFPRNDPATGKRRPASGDCRSSRSGSDSLPDHEPRALGCIRRSAG